MGNLFNYDNVIFSSLNKVFDCMFLSFLWLVFSIPVFTLGASTTALYYTVNKVIRHNRSHVWREFWGAFKSNFKQATISQLIFMVLFLIAGVDYFFVYYNAKTLHIPQIVCAVFLAMINILVVWVIYLFPYMARFDCTLKQLFKNTFFIFVLNILWSVLLWVIFIAMGVAVFLIPIAIFIVPTVGMLLMNLILERIFKKYMKPEDLEKEEERNKKYYD